MFVRFLQQNNWSSFFHSNLFSSLLCCSNPYISKRVFIIVLKLFVLFHTLLPHPIFLFFLSQNKHLIRVITMETSLFMTIIFWKFSRKKDINWNSKFVRGYSLEDIIIKEYKGLNKLDVFTITGFFSENFMIKSSHFLTMTVLVYYTIELIYIPGTKFRLADFEIQKNKEFYSTKLKTWFHFYSLCEQFRELFLISLISTIECDIINSYAILWSNSEIVLFSI